MYLAITDGTTTVVLSGTSPVKGCTYFPATPQMQDGAWQDVAETAEVTLQGTEGNIRSTINSIERLFEGAAQRQQGILQPRVYISYKPVDADSTAYRSECVEGRVVWSDNPGLRRLGDTSPTVQVGVVWLRRPWWEGAETEVQLTSNASGTAATGGKEITNDANNWVQVAAAQVTGTLPTPAKVKIQNTTGAAAEYTRFHLANNAYSDPANFVQIIEAEDAASGGTPAADATCSGGDKLSLTITTGATDAVAFTLSATLLQDTQGRWFRVLSRWDSLSGTCTIQLQLRSASGITLWAGEPIIVTALYTALLDLGTVPLPPGGYAASYGALQLVLAMRGPLVGAIDYLQLTPTDSYRYIELYGAEVGDDDYLVDDGIEGLTYILDGSAFLPIASPRGLPLMLYPNRLQRVHILHQVDAATPDAPVANTSVVQIYYRPRRLTV